MFDSTISVSRLVAYGFGIITLFGVYSFFRIRKKETDINWNPLEAISITVGIYFLSQIVGALIIVKSANVLGWDNQINSTLGQFAVVVLVEIISVGLVYFFIKKIRRTSLKAIGVVMPRGRDIVYALAGLGVYFLSYIPLMLAIKAVFPGLDMDHKQELGFNFGAAGPELLIIFVSLVILPPLAEEFLVRGFLYTGIRTKLKPILAGIITSLIFAMAHLQWGSGKPLLWLAAIDTFVLSMVLVYLRQKTGSLWPGIGLHFIKNGIAFVVLFILKIS